MGFTLNQVVPWGRNLKEYRQMFDLTEADLHKKILGCADGPASFNAELYRSGRSCISIDPIYQFSATQIRERIRETSGKVAEQLRQNRQDYVWDFYHSPEEVIEIRLAAMQLFLADFEQGKTGGRYVAGALPTLPFANQTFDLVLCSYCLFTYAEQLDFDFHYQSVLEMCRVGKEVKLFPLLELDGKPYRHLEELIKKLRETEIATAIATVPYEFQKGGKSCAMLVENRQTWQQKLLKHIDLFGI